MRLRFGPLEIIIIIVVILVLFGASKLSGLNRGSSNKKSSSERTVARKPSPPIKHPGLQLFGLMVIAIGLILLGVSYGLLKLIAPWGIWALVIIGVGGTIVLLARRR